MVRKHLFGPVVSGVLAGALAAPVGASPPAPSAAPTSRSLAPAPDLALKALMRPAVVASIAAWGVDVDAVIEDVGRLEREEVARIVTEAARLEGRDWQRSARDQAMYLVLVTQIRESLLFARILSRFRGAHAGADERPVEPEPAR